jgi:predicted ArsR family transcriptional regulator
MPEPAAPQPVPAAAPADPARSAPAADVSPSGGSSSTLRRAILLHLRRAGPAEPDAIADSLQASRSGVAQQLRALDAAGLVSRTAVRHGVGRPRHQYDVTALAQDLFPSNYDGLATGLLAAILEVGGDSLVEDVFAARRRQAQTRLRQQIDAALPPAAPLADRVRELARIQDELGYLAEAYVDQDGIRLVEHNCAVLDVASATPAACQAELELFRGVLRADVTREQHIAGGDRCCEYRVGPRD